MKFTYKPSGVCSSQIDIEIDEPTNTIISVQFERGCDGNATGLSALLVGMSVDEAIKRLEGTPCGSKKTSCPDQLAQALKTVKK